MLGRAFTTIGKISPSYMVKIFQILLSDDLLSVWARTTSRNIEIFRYAGSQLVKRRVDVRIGFSQHWRDLSNSGARNDFKSSFSVVLLLASPGQNRKLSCSRECSCWIH